MAVYEVIWGLLGFMTGAFMIWSSGDDIEIGDLFILLLFILFGPVTPLVILIKIIKETEFWKITIYRRSRPSPFDEDRGDNLARNQ